MHWTNHYMYVSPIATSNRLRCLVVCSAPHYSYRVEEPKQRNIPF
jgi:hypothetical protein